MSKQEVNDWIRKQIANNDVVVFMKGTKQFSAMRVLRAGGANSRLSRCRL